jgi:TolB protein
MTTSRRSGLLGLLAVLVLVADLAMAAPAQATLPGRNGAIAFEDDGTGQLYSVNPDGSSLRQLTHVVAPAFAGQPDWSPDAKRIAFISTLTGDFRLYIMDSNGSHQVMVFDDGPGFADFAPAFTPDGHRLVFQRCPPEPLGGCAIYSIGVTGKGLRALTHFKSGADEALDSGPAVAADGRIAFGRTHFHGVQSQVYVMAADGSGAHPITAPALLATRPDWTPDGRHVLVHSNGFRNGDAVVRVRADGADVQSVTRPRFPHNDLFPSASPDGKQVAFASDRRFADLCCLELYMVRADGTGLHRVPTGNLTGVAFPDWGTVPS